MTPKEKAFHLHFNFIRDVIADNEKAKQCALIAVNEILNILPPTYNDYWDQVKKEIENL